MEEDPSEPEACLLLQVDKKLSQPSKEPLRQAPFKGWVAAKEMMTIASKPGSAMRSLSDL